MINCISLTTEELMSIGDYAFSQCSSLTDITIPEGVTSIGKYAFENCSKLASIMIPSSVTSIEYNAFYNHNAVLTIYGVSGSYAETYAKKNSITFSAQE